MHPQPSNPEETFIYDPVGNRLDSHLATGQVHDSANRLLEDSNFTYTYDANGNLIEKRNKGTGNLTLYSYDPENQLITVERFTVVGGSAPIMVAEYRYDALGRRIEKVVNGVSTRFVYDNEDIILEVDGTGRSQAISLHGPGIDEPLAVSRRTEAGFGTFIYHADGLGSISTLTDLNGDPVRTYTYDSFGRIVDQTGAVTNPYTYAAREFDAETGLYYYRTRYYNPAVGTFLSEDTLPGVLELPQSLNRYPYVGNNPATFTDPFGLVRFRIFGQVVDVQLSTTFLPLNIQNDLQGLERQNFSFNGVFPPLSLGIGFAFSINPPNPSECFFSPFIGPGREFSIGTNVVVDRNGKTRIKGFNFSVGPSIGFPVGVFIPRAFEPRKEGDPCNLCPR